jgi:hypothetical protein
MKNIFDNNANVTISGYSLNSIADCANIDTSQLLGSVNNVLYCADCKTLDESDLYYLAQSAISIIASINALRDTIESEYKTSQQH